jgi:hypothetical protein
MLAVGLSTLLATAMVGLLPASADDDINYGDLNDDGVVDMLDNVVLNRYLVGMYALYNCEAADLNCNGVIDTVDSQIMAAYLVMNIKQLPYLEDTM